MKTYHGTRSGDGTRTLVVTSTKEDGTGLRTLPLGPSLEVWNHSPTGFECGYAGSGPAQLALALLLDHQLTKESAVAFHQDLKRDLVCLLPRSGPWEVTGQEIQLWLDQTEVQAQMWRLKFDGSAPSTGQNRHICPPEA